MNEFNHQAVYFLLFLAALRFKLSCFHSPLNFIPGALRSPYARVSRKRQASIWARMAHHESNLLEADIAVRSGSGSPCEAGSSESACPAGRVDCLKALPLWADALSQAWHLHTGHSEGSGGGKPWSQLHSKSVCLLHALYKMAPGWFGYPRRMVVGI